MQNTTAAAARTRSLGRTTVWLLRIVFVLAVCAGGYDAVITLPSFMWPLQTLAVNSSVCGTWQVLSTPVFGLLTKLGSVNSIVATAEQDVWIGGHLHEWDDNLSPQLFTVHWSGVRGQVINTPNPAFQDLDPNQLNLNGMAVVSENDIWAVGGGFTDGQTLIEHWDGSRWSWVASPRAGQINTRLIGVTAISKNDIWAVGVYDNDQRPLALHWDGNAWKVFSDLGEAKEDSALSAVTAVASDDVWAVGNRGRDPLIEHWTGNQWTAVPSPRLCSGYYPMEDIAAISATDIWATGVCIDKQQATPLTMHWDGAQWSLIPTPNTGVVSTVNNQYAGLAGVTLTGLAAIATDDVWAVGHEDRQVPQPAGSFRNLSRTVAMHWDGGAWSLVPSPNTNESQKFVDVAATGQKTIWALGMSSSGNNVYLTRFDRTPCPIP